MIASRFECLHLLRTIILQRISDFHYSFPANIVNPAICIMDNRPHYITFLTWVWQLTD